jgi:uncharacterized membrane protein
VGGTPIARRRKAPPPPGNRNLTRRIQWVLALVFAGQIALIFPAMRQGIDLVRIVALFAASSGGLLVMMTTLRRSPSSCRSIEAVLERAIEWADHLLEGRRGSMVLLSMMISYAAVWSILSILRHQGLNSTGFDLAIQHQVIWNLAHGHGFASSIEVSNYLGDHVALTMPLFVPWLWVWDDVRMLLIAQSIVLALGAWPIFRVARRHGGGGGNGVFWAFVYLLTPAIGYMNKYDFHEVVIAIPLLLAAIDAMDERRIAPTTFWLFLAALTREEIGIAVAAIAIYAIFGRGWRVWGGAVAGISTAWSVIALFVVIPHFRGGVESDTLARYGWLGGSAGWVARTLLTEPWQLFASHYHRVRRLLFPFQLVWPIGGLPLFAPAIAVLAIPSLAISLASSNISQNSIYFQYNAPILPILYWSALEGARRLRQRGIGRGLICGFVLVCLAAANLADPAAQKAVPRPYAIVDGIRSRANRAAFTEAALRIPPSASLIAENALAPHFSARGQLYVYNPRKNLPDADWAILDLSDVRHIDSPIDLARGAVRLCVEGGYRIDYFRDGILVLRKRGDDDPAARAAFTSMLGRLGLVLR